MYPSLLSGEQGVPERNRIVMARVVVATDYSFAEKGDRIPTDRRSRSACGARFGSRAERISGLTLDRAYGMGWLLAGWTRSALDRHHRAAQRAGARKCRGVAAIAPATNLKGILDMNVEMGKRLDRI